MLIVTNIKNRSLAFNSLYIQFPNIKLQEKSHPVPQTAKNIKILESVFISQKILLLLFHFISSYSISLNKHNFNITFMYISNHIKKQFSL